MASDFEQRYRAGDTPWDSGCPCSELQRVLAEYPIAPCRALEVGCGTGPDSVYLASRGFDVIAVDLAPTAIAAAEKRAGDAGVHCRFLVGDVLDLPDLGEPFPFIFDQGCFHAVRRADEAGMVRMFARQLAPGGHLLLLAGNAREQHHPGPPTVSEDELRRAFADGFEIIHLREFRFETHPDRNLHPLAWSLLLRNAS